jgi:hypothetical protein
VTGSLGKARQSRRILDKGYDQLIEERVSN